MNAKLYILTTCFILIGHILQAQETTEKISAFKDSTDGAYDISDFLLKKEGFLPIPAFITEPAVGYGAALAAIYFHSSYSEKKGPPSMSGLVVAGTQNGTWAGGAFHAGYWNQDRLRYMGAVARGYINIGYYGIGFVNAVEGEAVNLNLNAWIFFQQLKGRIGESNFFFGGKYILFDTDNTLEAPIDIPDYKGTEFSSVLSEPSLMLNYDSRNNVFSPSRGFYIDLSGTYTDEWMGSEALYGRIGFDILSYLPVNKKLLLSIRYESNYTMGDVPFYARPMVQLRGAPLMKYQDNHTTVFEGEMEWNVYRRWSITGFTGMGTAYSKVSEFESGKNVQNLGTGFRYLLARKFGAKMGMDFALTQEDFAFYFVFGTAWLR